MKVPMEIRTNGAGKYVIRGPQQPMQAGHTVAATFEVSEEAAGCVIDNGPLRGALNDLLRMILAGEAYPVPPTGVVFDELFPAFIEAAERIKAGKQV